MACAQPFASWLGRSGKLREVADVACFMASDRAGYVHGVTLNVAGGKTRG